MRFSEIIGNKEIKQKLIRTANSGRISNTQLFLGAEGSGNLALAIAYAQYINCTNATNEDSCGICPSCVKYQKYIHPDLHFTFPTVTPIKTSIEILENWREAILENVYQNDYDWLSTIDKESKKQGNITAEECRDIFRRLSLKAFEAKYKVLIIWMPEYLKTEGNILLKLLEEPPVGTLILLVANDSEKILGTILSRAQLVKIPKIKDEDIIDSLINQKEIEPKNAEAIARISDGNYNLALQLIDVKHESYSKTFMDWLRECYASQKDFKKVLDRSEEFAGMGKETLKSFLDYSLQMIRATFIYKYGDRSTLRVSDEEFAFFDKFSKMMNANNIENISKAMGDAIFHIERNANVKIMVLNLSLYIGTQLKSA
ncbi:MAG: DNA polymerase III subunit delta [Bacteroidetes bacterium]|nr:DNA polymerase III subunit delta [Bacteroidota bacterium]